MSDRDVDLVAEYADCMQVGARNMQNFALLKSLGGCGRPVLLKRGMSSTIKELLMSAEYIVAHGNPNVILCERGIRTFETATRNTCDIAAVPVLNELTHLPVILDPSHATGKRSLVPGACARRCRDRRRWADHRGPSRVPEKAVSDGAQSLTLPAFRAMMARTPALYPSVEVQRARRTWRLCDTRFVTPKFRAWLLIVIVSALCGLSVLGSGLVPLPRAHAGRHAEAPAYRRRP